jgi:hypothetical protein
VKPLAVILFMAMLSFSQVQPKMVVWSKSPASSKTGTAADIRPADEIDALQIEDVAAEGKSITIGQGFVAGEDWIQTITFRVKNISTQQFMAIQITVVLPEMSIGGPDIVFCYGCAKAEREKGVAPDEEVELKIIGGDKYYGWVKDKIAAQGNLSRISKAQIRDMFVTLPDGTKLLSGCVKTADPKNACPHGAT